MPKSPRMIVCALIAVALLAAVWSLSPQQGPVIAYKLALITLSAFCGYWIDRWAFPYARPDGYLKRNWRTNRQTGMPDVADYPVVCGHRRIFCAAIIRRAIIMGCTMLAVGMGL